MVAKLDQVTEEGLWTETSHVLAHGVVQSRREDFGLGPNSIENCALGGIELQHGATLHPIPQKAIFRIVFDFRGVFPVLAGA